MKNLACCLLALIATSPFASLAQDNELEEVRVTANPLSDVDGHIIQPTHVMDKDEINLDLDFDVPAVQDTANKEERKSINRSDSRDRKHRKSRSRSHERRRKHRKSISSSDSDSRERRHNRRRKENRHKDRSDERDYDKRRRSRYDRRRSRSHSSERRDRRYKDRHHSEINLEKLIGNIYRGLVKSVPQYGAFISCREFGRKHGL